MAEIRVRFSIQKRIDLNELGKHRIQHLFLLVHQLIHYVICGLILVFQFFLSSSYLLFHLHDFHIKIALLICAPILRLVLLTLQIVQLYLLFFKICLFTVPQGKFLIDDVIFIIPQLIVFIQSYHLCLEIIQSLFLALVALIYSLRIMVLQMRVWK